ncbi:flagellar protein FlaG [bacterium]|nr:flagellar protein FlaG [bacterium]
METTPINHSVEEVSDAITRQAPMEGVQQNARVQRTRPEVTEKAQKEENAAEEPFTDTELEDIAAKMNQVSGLFNTTLNFTVDKPTGKTVIKVMDRETDELIRQIPPENLLKLMTNMRDVMGMLLDVEI